MHSETIAFRHRVMMFLVCGIAASGCGNFLESDDRIARSTVGEAGGALHLDVFSLTVPPHALSHTITFSLSHAGIQAPGGQAFVLGPADAMFDPSAPASITITFDPATYPQPSEVFVATFAGAAWHALPPAGTLEAGSAHASTTHAGTFGIIHCPGGTCPTSNSDASVGH